MNPQSAPVSTNDPTAELRAAPAPAAALPETLRSEQARQELWESVCARVAPVFPLQDWVAVSPMTGVMDQHWVLAGSCLERSQHVQLMPSLEWWRAAHRAGALRRRDVQWAVEEHNMVRAVTGLPEVHLQEVWRALTEDELPGLSHGARLLSVAQRWDERAGSDLVHAIAREVSSLCAMVFDRGVARLGGPLATKELFDAFCAYACSRRGAAPWGLGELSALVGSLPREQDAALVALASHIEWGGVEPAEYFARLLGEIPGWAGMLRARRWHAPISEAAELRSLLLVRLAYDAALVRRASGSDATMPRGPVRMEPSAGHLRELAIRHVLLLAAESASRHRVLSKLPPASRVKAELRGRDRPAVQAAFCIDVRSEGIRRALEDCGKRCETYGFAGFFGMPVNVEIDGDAPRPHAPALLDPPHRVRVTPPSAGRLRSSASELVHSVVGAANGGFGFVETLGFVCGSSLLTGTRDMRWGGDPERAPIELDAVPEAARIELAETALRHLALRAPYARLVVLCGHDTRAANNPQRAGLACGACCGHGGGVNARLAAGVLNEPSVRQALLERGTHVPHDTWFVPAVHDTTTQSLRVLDADRVPASHAADLAELRRALSEATRRVRRQKIGHRTAGRLSDTSLAKWFRRRGEDWAEVRPEWGLVNNAWFVAAREERLRGSQFDGRAFLHNHDFERDDDGSSLELILSAPVAVASWINWQYFASTVCPDDMGSGDKNLHSITAGLGVTLGAGGDLAVGLPWQCVHDGSAARHEPVRLQVFVEDTVERIEEVLQRRQDVRHLVEHGYVVLLALDPHGEGCQMRLTTGGWRPIEDPCAQ